MNEIMQNKYMEFQLLQQQMQQLQQQLELVQHQVIQLTSLNDSINEIKKTKTDSEILVPLGAGVYIKSSLKDNKEIIMNVGAKTAVPKGIDDASDIIEKQIGDMKEVVNDITSELGKMAARNHSLQEEIQAMVQEQQNKGKENN